MTTVAYDGKTIAADRFWGTCYGDKLVRVGNLAIGFCGSAKMFNRVVAYFTSGGDPPALGDDNEALVVNLVTGCARLYDGDMDWIDVVAPVAIGSGRAYAAGAMAMGASACGAVMLAGTLDAATKTDQGFTSFDIGEPIGDA